MVDRCGQDVVRVNLQVLSLSRFCVTRVVDVLDVVKENFWQVCVLSVDNQLAANKFKKKKNVGMGVAFLGLGSSAISHNQAVAFTLEFGENKMQNVHVCENCLNDFKQMCVFWWEREWGVL